MPPKKKAPAPSTGHETGIDEYKSTMMNMTLYGPYCSCGWSDVRYFTEGQAKARNDQHKSHS